MIIFSSKFANRTTFFEDGKFIGSVTENPFGNVTQIHDAAGHVIGSVHDLGQIRQYFDESMMLDGTSRSNIFGGQDQYDASGHLTDRTAPTSTGQLHHHFDHAGVHTEHTSVFGADVDHSDFLDKWNLFSHFFEK